MKWNNDQEDDRESIYGESIYEIRAYELVGAARDLAQSALAAKQLEAVYSQSLATAQLGGAMGQLAGLFSSLASNASQQLFDLGVKVREQERPLSELGLYERLLIATVQPVKAEEPKGGKIITLEKSK